MAPKAADFTACSELFRLLSDRTRLQIVLLLAAQESNVTNLCEVLKLPQPTVSHHLGLLRMNRLVSSRRNGKQVIYTLADYAKVTGQKLRISLPPYNVTLEGY